MSARKHRLVDCNPSWATESDGRCRYLMFDCPEGHEGCRYAIPFTPALNGISDAPVLGEAAWTRIGDTFETLTLSPSIRGLPKYESREQAIAAGCDPEWVHPRMWCALHIHIHNGKIEFCGDSR